MGQLWSDQATYLPIGLCITMESVTVTQTYCPIQCAVNNGIASYNNVAT